MDPKVLFIYREENGGKTDWMPESRSALAEAFRLPIGVYKLVISKVKAIKSSRYKYHFAHVLPMIVEYMNRKGISQILDPMTGELLPIEIDNLHNYHKQVYNPCLVKNLLKKPDARGNTPEFIPIPMSTTKLSDGDFIDTYEERIISEYANTYGIEFLSREEYNLLAKDRKSSKQIVDMQIELMEN